MATRGTLGELPPDRPVSSRRPHSPSRSKRSALNGSPAARWLVVASLIAMPPAIFLMTSGSNPEPGNPPAVVEQIAALRAAETARPNYRYSVIAGGAYSSAELVAAASNDAVVAESYGAVARRVRPSPVVGRRLAHLSYRIGNQIYWTKRKLPLTPGEMTLTDGDIEIRSRCGNQISETARLPTSPSEPDAVEFDRLVSDEPDLLATHQFPFGIQSPPIGLPGGAAPGTIGDPTPGTMAPIWGASSDQQPGWTGLFGGIIGGFPTASPASGLPPGQPADPAAPGPDKPPPPTAIGGPPGGGPPAYEFPDVTPEIPWPPDPYLPPSEYDPPSIIEDVPVAIIPEPGTLVLLGTALTGLAVMVLRKRQRARQSVQDPPI